MRRRVTKQRKAHKSRFGEVLGILLAGSSAFIFLGLISYDSLDISWVSAQPNDPIHNYVGLVGAWFSFFAFFLVGLAAFLIPFYVGVFGIRAFWKGSVERFWACVGLVCANLVSLACLLELQGEIGLERWSRHFGISRLGPGGLLGEWILKRALVKWIGVEGSCIFLYSTFFATIVFLTEIQLAKAGLLFAAAAKKIFWVLSHGVNRFLFFAKRLWIVLRERSSKKSRPVPLMATERLADPPPLAFHRRAQEKLEKSRKPDSKAASAEEKKSPLPEKEPLPESRVQLELISQGDYQLPSVTLLDEGLSFSDSAGPEDLERNAQVLKSTLKEFGVDVEVLNITQGPVITRYELGPAPGVKVQSITGLSNDIALALKVGSVRIVAPIPGKAAVGVEVPNTTSAMVSLRELLESSEFKGTKARIPLTLGKDVSGVPIVVDLTEMPHLLIAGATGSGKSVCMSSLILNILFYATPDYVRFLLIDPKMVELSVFEGLPHLAVPVVTQSRKAASALAWLVTEMERRYKILAEVGVRNIEFYNEKVLKEKVMPRTGEEPFKPLPYIVVVIDELADIMLVSSYEVENSIARLAQLSRAIGIHLVLATQRPSVDVITGVIKANFPARISFQVSSKVDSRTVLDTIGAEKLLGKGDMLYMPPGSSKLIRAQGAYVRDAEIKKVLEFIKAQNISSSEVLKAEEILERSQNLNTDLNQLDDETLMNEAIQVIRNTAQASVSILQRKLKLGYSRAARIMDLLEERGVVGPYKGSKARDILIDVGAKAE